MKRAVLLAAGIAAALAATPAALAQPSNSVTLYPLATVNGRVAYVATETRTRSGDTAEVWGFIAETTPPTVDGKRVFGAWLHMRYTCAGRTSKTVEVVALDENLAVAFASSPSDAPGPLPANSIASGMYDWACDGVQHWTGAPVTSVAAATQAAQKH